MKKITYRAPALDGRRAAEASRHFSGQTHAEPTADTVERRLAWLESRLALSSDQLRKLIVTAPFCLTVKVGGQPTVEMEQTLAFLEKRLQVTVIRLAAAHSNSVVGPASLAGFPRPAHPRGVLKSLIFGNL